jgi:hypothetical protein
MSHISAGSISLDSTFNPTLLTLEEVGGLVAGPGEGRVDVVG